MHPPRAWTPSELIQDGPDHCGCPLTRRTARPVFSPVNSVPLNPPHPFHSECLFIATAPYSDCASDIRRMPISTLTSFFSHASLSPSQPCGQQKAQFGRTCSALAGLGCRPASAGLTRSLPRDSTYVYASRRRVLILVADREAVSFMARSDRSDLSYDKSLGDHHRVASIGCSCRFGSHANWSCLKSGDQWINVIGSWLNTTVLRMTKSTRKFIRHKNHRGQMAV